MDMFVERARPLRHAGRWLPLLFLWGALSCAVRVPGRASGPVALAGATMGTTYVVRLAGLPAGVFREAVAADIEALLEDVDARMSTYRPDSEIVRFNASRGTGWVEVSAGLATVVATARAVSRLTGGAFDVTVAPLVDLWGFGPTVRPAGVPPPAAIAAARERVGYRRVHVRRRPPALRKSLPDVALDLSAIAKGYALDRVAERLEALGVEGFMVEIGGEVRARGPSPEGGPWRIGIERPVAGGGSIEAVACIDDAALATSGDYRNAFELDGRRYTHTIDPGTGWPVAHGLASVSVVDASAMCADALATALMVLGPEKGWRLAERRGVAALFVVRTGEGFHERATRAMRPALEPPPGVAPPVGSSRSSANRSVCAERARAEGEAGASRGRQRTVTDTPPRPPSVPRSSRHGPRSPAYP
jgi:thiamine biosynthesis lipoprotein